MPHTTVSRATNEDTDRGVRGSREMVEREAGKQLACAFALYANKIRAWLDLNLESRRPDSAAGPATRKASGTGR